MGLSGFNVKYILIFVFSIATVDYSIFLHLAHKIVILEHILVCS